MSVRLSRSDVIMMRRARPFSSFQLMPVDDRAIDAIDKVPVGEIVGVRIMRGRSLPQHNLLWSILDKVGRATKYETGERLLAEIKLHFGRYDLMKMPDGEVVRVLDSISFGAMTQGEFQAFMDDAMVFICTEVLPGTSVESLFAGAL